MTSERSDDGLLGLAERIAGVGHWRFDIATRKITWSDEVFRIHGLSRTGVEPEYADLIELYHPDDRNVLSALVDRAMTLGEGYDLEWSAQ